MKRLAMIIGFTLLAGSVAAYGQSIEDLDLNSLLAQVQTPFGPVNASKAGKMAALETGLQGTWWRDARWIRALDLTPDQQKKIDDAFRQNRIKLIDLTATLEKAELMLEPLVENVHPGDEPKILAQIDEIANARAELEKVNARMLLGIRQVLTQDQWDKLPKTKPAFSFSLGGGKFIGLSDSPAPPAPPEKK
jgi:Spy/CpxP family protein refolding chaperone